MTKKTSNRFSPEVRQRAVRMVLDHGGDHASQWAAIDPVAAKIDCTAETLRKWVCQAEHDRGQRPGTTKERERIKALEREVRELRHPSLLAGMLTDPAGEAMVATHASKAGRRYRYYVSNRLITGTRDDHADALRLPAAALEQVIIRRIARFLTNGPELLDALRSAAVLPAEGADQRRILSAAQNLASRWHQQGHGTQRETLLAFGIQVAVQRHEITIHLAPRRLVSQLDAKRIPATRASSAEGGGEASRISLTVPVALRRADREMALLVGSTVAADRSDPSLVRLVAKALALREALVSSKAPSLTAFAAEQGISQSYATRLVRLAWLAPDIMEAILDGRQPAGLTASGLMRDTRIPLDWQDQRKALGFV